MRIAIATDAWCPQINGVVRTLAATVAELDHRGYEVEMITPERFRTVPMPGYGSIDLAIAPRFSARKLLKAFQPDIVHIATEGPIGWSARGWCKAHDVPYTSAFHTRFPDYAAVRTGISAERFWPIFRRFHRSSRAVLAATPSLERELNARGIDNVRRWTRGISHRQFRPDGDLHRAMIDLPRPILLNVGRVAPEKNLEAFLALDVPGTKVIVGDGPALETLRQRYPDAVFLGSLGGEELASAYRSADCFVFPSLTDTFGLVVIEALACGTPVAAYPVPGPIDILGEVGRGCDNDFPARIGAVHADLGEAIACALQVDRKAAAVFARRFTWETATDQFLSAVQGALALQNDPTDRNLLTPSIPASRAGLLSVCGLPGADGP
ncbi:MAG: glycosyltransferase family 1 protein [Sphingomonadales bacterium]|nr:glycosyltransferase family 1 protein [Sphingomonadales bacterium]